MNGPKNTDFADRLSAAANAKKAQLERAARARSAAESPAAVERRSARDAVRVARDARIAERTATKLAIEAQQAAALAAAQATEAVEAAAREAALKAEQEARDMEFAERAAGKPPWKKSGKPLATPAMLHAKLGNEKADKASIDRWTKQNLSPLFVRSSQVRPPSVAAPRRTRVRQRPLRSFGPSPTPILRGKAIGPGALTNLAQPDAAAKSP